MTSDAHPHNEPPGEPPEDDPAYDDTLSETHPSPGRSTIPMEPQDHPSHIGQYRVVRKLGSGGMGVVYEAEQQQPRRPVALKVIRGGHLHEDYYIKLFQREIQTLAHLRHAGIASIYEAGQTRDGQYFYTMELVRGDSLRDFLRSRPDGNPRGEIRLRLELFRKLCEAIHYAHQRGVIHRDLKPTNVVVAGGGTAASGRSTSSSSFVPDIKVLDFGLARITTLEEDDPAMVTQVGQIRGTLAYMSPEQARGNPDELDVRSDVYSLGVILYEMLTEQLPYQVSGVELPEAIRIICKESPRSPGRALRSLDSVSDGGALRIDTDLETVVLKSLEKEPHRRYQSAQALAEDVERYLNNEPIHARPPSTFYQFRKLVARHRTPFAFAVLLLLTLVGFAITMTVLSARIARERDDALEAKKEAEDNLKRALQAERQIAGEAEMTRRVTEFLVGIFRVSDPSEARGNRVTAREVLDAGARSITEELSDRPLVRAQLQATMGRVYRSLGLYRTSRPHSEDALRLREAEVGEGDVEAIEILHDLGRLDFAEGRYLEAERRLRRVLELRREYGLGPDERDTRYKISYGTVLARIGRYPEARKQHLEALELRERTNPGESTFTADAKSSLAQVERELGNYDQAGELFQEALSSARRRSGEDSLVTNTIRRNYAMFLAVQGHYSDAREQLETSRVRYRELYGESHPAYADVLSSLGWVMHREGRHSAKSQEYLEQAIAIRKSVLDREDSVSAAYHNHLGQLLHANGDLDGAEKHQRISLDLRKRELGVHQEVATSLNDLALVLDSQGKFDEAESLSIEAIGVYRAVFGDSSPFLAIGLNNLASILGNEGKFQEALERVDQSLAMARKHYGDRHPTVAISLGLRGWMLSELGRNKEAEEAYLEDLSILREFLPPEHREIGFAERGLGWVRLGRNDTTGAHDQFQKALETLRKCLGPEHVEVARTESALGWTLVGLGRTEEAEQILDHAYEVQLEKLGPDHPQTISTVNNLGVVAFQKGQFEKAFEFLEKTLVGRQKILAPDHPDVALSMSNVSACLLLLDRDLERAERLCQTALGIRRQAFSEEHYTTVESKLLMGMILAAQKRGKAAEIYLREPLEIYERMFPGTFRVYVAQSSLGYALTQSGEPGDGGKPAEALLLEGYEGLVRTLGAAHPHTQRAQRYLVELYERQGRTEDAARARGD